MDNNYICTNISQSFSNVLQQNARRNIGLDPFSGKCIWCFNQRHSLNEQEVQLHCASITLGNLPDIIKNSGKPFIAECVGTFIEVLFPFGKIPSGDYGVMVSLEDDSGFVHEYETITLLSDMIRGNTKGHSSVSFNIPFHIRQNDLNNTYTLNILFPRGFNLTDLELNGSVYLHYVQIV